MSRIAIIPVLLFCLVHQSRGQSECEIGTAEALLEANEVRASIANTGGLFLNGYPLLYEVPAGSGLYSLISTSFWIGGMIEGSLRMSAARYRDYEMWPGPVGATRDECERYDQIYSVADEDLDIWHATGEATSDMEGWPWEVGAPVVDGDGISGNYNLPGGDRPEVLGDQTLWWIMNDAGGVHQKTKTEPLRMEVATTVFASELAPPLSKTTFYRYVLTYKGVSSLTDAYLALHVDPDIGADYVDDAVGSDTTLGMGFAYNYDDVDEGGYGEAPPAIGILLLDSPAHWKTESDSDNPDPRVTNYMTSMIFWVGVDHSHDILADSPERFYNFMRGWFGTSERQTEGGNGLNRDGVVTPFSFPGEPGEYWSELKSGRDDSPRRYDRQFVISSGPFDLEPGESTTFYFAIVWSRGRDHLDSVRQLKKDAAIVKQVAPTLLKPIYSYEPDIPPEPEFPLGANDIYPNPASDEAIFEYSLPRAMHVRLEVFDVLGRRVLDGVRGIRDAGEYTERFEVADWPSGVYTVRFQLDHATSIRTFVLTR